MKTKNKGISLIVLVITIIVIIILAGAVILNMMQNNPTSKAKEAIFKTDVATYKDELTMYHLTKTVDALGNYEKNSLNKAGQELKNIISSMKETDVAKFEIKSGELIYIGTESNEIEWSKELLANPDDLPEVPEEETGWNETKGVNSPVLAEGMTPIKWNGTDWENTTKTDTTWYNYENKEWANAKTSDGSFWVWIPRYEYKIENPHTSTAEEIKVNFIRNIQKDATSGYIMHPAFTFGDDELTGIWIAKFEATAREGIANVESGDNVKTKNVKISPNETSWRYITVSNAFDVTRKMETDATYGWGTSGNGIDTHLMKNIEWGAVAYLSHSKYGKNSEIWINPNLNYITGQAGSSANSSSTTTTNAYTTTNGMQASTTGNITGVYDMSGGAGEYVAAYIDNSNIILAKYGASIRNAQSKYKDIYQIGNTDTQQLNYNAALNKVGDAIYETSASYSGSKAWYSDYSYMVYSENSVFMRGGFAGNGAGSGGFTFSYSTGNVYSNVGFRVTLCVANVL